MHVMERYHVIQRNIGLCLTCYQWCEQCNQCRCEIGKKRLCPQFDVKRDQVRFTRWNLELELNYLVEARQYDPNATSEKWVWYSKKIVEIQNILSGRTENGEWDALYARRDSDGLAYYDR